MNIDCNYMKQANNKKYNRQKHTTTKQVYLMKENTIIILTSFCCLYLHFFLNPQRCIMNLTVISEA